MTAGKNREPFMERFRKIKYKKLGKTDYIVSICGFGGYRVDDSVPEHHEALEYALMNGINLIDTSANYSDGGSEKLIGNVIGKISAGRDFSIDDFIIVTKGGYIQGGNLNIAVKKENEGNAYPDVIKCSPDLWHCIHPDFLKDQITLSLKRLNLGKINIYLLHNPEYFLTYSFITDEAARIEEYYKRIETAFRFLESEVSKGRINYYGISSNTFGEPDNKMNFSSLQRVKQIADVISSENHFAVIQLPLNIVERGGVTNLNQANNSLSAIEYAAENNIGVLINRPLNTIIKNRLRRLADYKVNENRSPEEIGILIEDLREQERSLAAKYINKLDIPPVEKRTVYECLSLAQILEENKERFESPNQFKEIKGLYLIPRANYAISQLNKLNNDNTELTKELNNYAVTTNILLDSIESDLVQEQNNSNLETHSELNRFLTDEQKKLTLSQKAVLMINSLSETTCTLVGMRKKLYVDDVISGIKSDYIKDAKTHWKGLKQN
jgi:aryl-alcohol dehydrogenase-like predicted oxidoreductase